MNEARMIDALLPPEMASRAEAVGVKKANAPLAATFVLAVLAGAFVAMGAVLSTTVVAGAAGKLPFGVVRLLAGATFSLGLVLVVVGGAELFTGNALLVMALASRKVTLARVARQWGVVYAGNFVGAVGTAALVFLGGQWAFGDGVVGMAALETARHKMSLGVGRLVMLGIACNALVCLAVWLSYSARSTTDRVLAVVGPVTAFVAAGFEHSIANMYFVPVALLLRDFAPVTFWRAIGQDPSAYSTMSWSGFLVEHLPAVTLGNLVGGVVLVGLVYWFVYLRRDSGVSACAKSPRGSVSSWTAPRP
jgi:formate transporter